MRFLAFLLVAPFFASAHAFAFYKRQQAPPSCAMSCITDPTLPYRGCSPLDYHCLCMNAQYMVTLQGCLIKACPNPDDLLDAMRYDEIQCETAGVSIAPWLITSKITPTWTGSGNGAPVPTSPPSTSTKAAASTTARFSAALFGIAFAGTVLAL